jgi:hypothetical protein
MHGFIVECLDVYACVVTTITMIVVCITGLYLMRLPRACKSPF